MFMARGVAGRVGWLRGTCVPLWGCGESAWLAASCSCSCSAAVTRWR